ncbi:MAG: 1-phosphofructokinase [Streptococcaceae bacterium]|nr:1-phosphofructokinase [Streptococcaceae bacterium]
MIYTITLNPAIDFIVRLDTLNIGEVNRMTSDDKFPGGKGINVSRLLNFLGTPTTALGFLGGFTGKFIEEKLQAEGICSDFTTIKQDTRLNIKLNADGETEINGAGPNITETEIQVFLQKLNQLTSEDIVILSGSAPKSLGNEFYQQIIKKIKERQAAFVIDVEGQMLINSLVFEPLLIKPNHYELAAMFETHFETKEEMIPYAKELLKLGSKHVLISMGGAGALMITKDAVYFAEPIKREVKNSVGAGDSMVAGFVDEFVKTQDALRAFKMGVACGSASAFCDDLASRALIEKVLEFVHIVKISE